MLLYRVKLLRPRLFPLSNAAGRKIAFDLLSPQGQLLLKRGARIKNKHLTRLQAFDTKALPVLAPETIWATKEKVDTLRWDSERLSVKTVEEEEYRLSRVVEKSCHLTTLALFDQFCLYSSKIHDLPDAREKLRELGEKSISLGQDVKKLYAALDSPSSDSMHCSIREALLKTSPVPESGEDPFPVSSPKGYKALKLMRRKRLLKSKHIELLLENENLPKKVHNEEIIEQRILEELPSLLEQEKEEPFSQEVFDNLLFLHTRLENKEFTSETESENYRELFETIFKPNPRKTSSELLKRPNLEGDNSDRIHNIKDFLRSKSGGDVINASESERESSAFNQFYSDVFPPAFMVENSRFPRFEDFVEESPVDEPDLDPTEPRDHPEWDTFVNKYTDFDSWQDMLNACNSYWRDQNSRDKRRHSRHTLGRAARIDTGEITCDGQIEDISRSGLGISTSARLKERQMVKITFRTPDKSGVGSESDGIPHLRILGVVRWARSTGENIPTKAGVEILRKEVIHLDTDT